MKHLIARHNHYYVIGLRDRAYLVFDTPGNDVPTETIMELLPSPNPKAIQPAAPPSSIPVKKSDSSSSPKSSQLTNDNNHNQKPQKNGDKVHDRQKSANEQFNEICAVAMISNNDKLVDQSSELMILRCAVARNNKSLDIYTVTLKDCLPKTSQSPSLHYRTPKRVSCFAFANIDENTTESSITNTKVPLLISGDVAGDSYAYNLLEKGQRLLLGHTASMLTDIAIVNGGESERSDNRLVLTSDRDEKIRISRFPETYVIEGFLLGHTTYVTGFIVVPSSSSALVVSCGGDMTLRLWDLTAQKEICSTSTSTCTSTITTNGGARNEKKNNTNEIPTTIAASCCGRIVAVIFDDSNRLSTYKITPTTNEGDPTDKPSLEFLGSVDCPSQPLSIAFHEVQRGESSTKGSNTGTMLTVVMKDPDYFTLYDIKHNNEDVVKPIAATQNETRAMKALRDIVSDEKIAMPNTILEKDDHGNPVLQKVNETRGPAATEAPWNRVERIDIAKEREKRRKKKPKLGDDS